MLNPTSQLLIAAPIGQTGTGFEEQLEVTRLGSERIAQLEQPGYEKGRCNKSFVGGMKLVAGGIVDAIDFVTTTAPFVLYNAGTRLFHIKRVTCYYASATMPANGYGIYAGVTPVPLATALTANDATNFATQSTRGYGLVTGYVGVAKTIVQPTWMHLGGITSTNSAVVGPSYTVDVTALGYIIPPTYAFCTGVLASVTGAPLFNFTVAWDELDGDLP